jgi:hypothetical protein
MLAVACAEKGSYGKKTFANMQMEIPDCKKNLFSW